MAASSWATPTQLTSSTGTRILSSMNDQRFFRNSCRISTDSAAVVVCAGRRGAAILVGAPGYADNRGGGFIYVRNGGSWNLVTGLSPYAPQHRLGWSVAISDGIAALGTLNYQGASGPFTALLGWANDLDSPQDWNVSAGPNTLDFAPFAVRMDISMDGPWVVMASLSATGLPQVIMSLNYYTTAAWADGLARQDRTDIWCGEQRRDVYFANVQTGRQIDAERNRQRGWTATANHRG